MPPGNRCKRVFADRHDTVLVTFAGYADRRILHVDVVDIQIG
jgi:hypothetical protein